MTRATEYLKKVKEIAVEAGNKIMNVYEYTDFAAITEFKSDDSPLTLADKAAHQVIASSLEKLYPSIPVLSEEGKHTDYQSRKSWQTFWLVDPLDGTKEFIKRNGEFTVNIALIENNKTVLGVIYAPVTQVLYYGTVESGAFRQLYGQQAEAIRVNHKKQQLVAVGSRSHADPAEADVLSKFTIENSVSIGSSLKFCLIAEGKADIYYRHGPTMEWDTAAGQAIVEAAGGRVLDRSGIIFTYNKPSLVNTSFLCQGF